VLAAPVPVVVDADALTLAGEPEVQDLLRARTAPTVLTPHDREYARVAGETVGSDRVAAAVRLARRLGAVVLLKGDRTVVAAGDGRAWVNPSGSPVLATAGTGDVLAGLLVSLLAAGVSPEWAALGAAYAHGLAGRAAAERYVLSDPSGFTVAPVTAPDVAAALPKVIGSLSALTH
jgi:hydroxyethylthiazole kinase-like uncharacterized protein yjeF